MLLVENQEGTVEGALPAGRVDLDDVIKRGRKDKDVPLTPNDRGVPIPPRAP